MATIQELRNKINQLVARTGLFSISKIEFFTLMTDIVEKLREAFDRVNSSSKSLIWQDPVATFDDLSEEYPTPEAGWASMVEDEGYVYSYNGAAWKKTGLTAFPEDVVRSSSQQMTDEQKKQVRDNINAIGVPEALVYLKNIVELEMPNVLTDGNSIMFDYEARETLTRTGTGVITEIRDFFGSPAKLSGAATFSSQGILFENVSSINNYLKSSALDLSQPCTIYLIFKQNSWTSGAYFFDGHTLESTWIRNGGTNPQIRIGTGSGTAKSSLISLSVGQFILLRVTFNGASSEIQINDSTVSVVDLGTISPGGITLGARGDLNSSTHSNMVLDSMLVRKIVDSADDKNIITNYLLSRVENKDKALEFSDFCDGDIFDFEKWDTVIDNNSSTKITKNNALEFYQVSNSAHYALLCSKIASKTGIFSFSAMSVCPNSSSTTTVRFGLMADRRNRIDFYHKLTGGYNLAFRIVKDGTVVYEVTDINKDFVQCKIIVTNTTVSAYLWVQDAWVQIGATQNVVFDSLRFFIQNPGISTGHKASMRDIFISATDFTTITPIPQKDVDAVDVRLYGAVPNGVTDSIASINNALETGNVILQNGVFAISSSILVPSNRTLFIRNAKIRLLDDSAINMIRGKSLTGENSNIKILGLGNAILDGNGANNGLYYQASYWLPDRKWQKSVMFLLRFKNFEIANLNCVDRFSYFSCVQDSMYGKIHDIYFNHYVLPDNPGVAHRDGIQITFGSHDIELYSLKGQTGDDFTSIYAGNEATQWHPSGSLSGEVYNIVYRNFIPSYGAGAVVDFICGNGNKIHDIIVTDMEVGNCYKFLQLGYPENQVPRPTIDEFYNFTIKNNVVNKAEVQLIHFLDNIKNVHVHNLTNNSGKSDYLITVSKVLKNVLFRTVILDQNN